MSMFALLLLWCVSSALAVRITRSANGVSFLRDNDEPTNASLSRRLIAGSAVCASTGGYTSGSCIATNPSGCGCAALTASEKQEILDLHNARRDLIANGWAPCAANDPGPEGKGAKYCPSATAMNYLFWDPALEVLSTFWAHQCIAAHHSTWHVTDADVPAYLRAGEYYLQWYSAQQSVLDHSNPSTMYRDFCDAGNCKATGFNFKWDTGVGWIAENMAFASAGSHAGSYSMDDILVGINGWYDESEDYFWGWHQAREGKSDADIGHWTTGAWAASRYVGCGYAICPGGEIAGANPWGETEQIEDWLNIVCKYYPGGNDFDVATNRLWPYTASDKTGTANGPCSACDADRQGCVSSATPIGEGPQNALCGGPQCAACAVDYNQDSCEYNFATCPSAMLTNDGTEGPAMAPTSRPVPFTPLTAEPTLPTPEPTPEPTTSTHAPLPLDHPWTLTEDSIACGETKSRYFNSYSTVNWRFELDEESDVTFSNCDTTAFDTYFRVWTQTRTLEVSKAWGHCDGNDCGDCGVGDVDIWGQDDSHREKFSIERMRAGSYLLELTPWTMAPDGEYILSIECSAPATTEEPDPVFGHIESEIACGETQNFDFFVHVPEDQNFDVITEDLYVRFTLDEARAVLVSNCETLYDTVLKIWSHDKSEEVSLTRGGCDGDDCRCPPPCHFLNEQISIGDLPAGTYYLQIGPQVALGSEWNGMNIHLGNYTLSVECSEPAIEATVPTGSPTDSPTATAALCCNCLQAVTTSVYWAGCAADEECEAAVCATDSYCCSTAWDDICVENIATPLCEEAAAALTSDAEADTDTDTDASVLTWINIDMGTDAEKAALVAAVALIICAAMLVMVRRAAKCMRGETRYAKVQLHEDSSEPVTQSEAEEILHASD